MTRFSCPAAPRKPAISRFPAASSRASISRWISCCIGTSTRQGALSITQLEIMPKPPLHEDKLLTWPDWPLKLRTSSSQEEGAERDFAVGTVKFSGENGVVKTLHCAKVDDKF